MTIPIVFSANNYYVPYTAVSIQSIMEHGDKKNDYHFYILHKDISGEFIDLLRKQVSPSSNCSIDFIDVSTYISDYNFFVSREITVEAYFRLLIPYILTDYDKVIYLDGDTICLIDICELYKIELNANLLSAVRDVGVSWYYSPDRSKHTDAYQVLLHLKKPEDYFNSGMLVLDTNLFRKTYTLKHLCDFAASREFQVHDQDVLNTLCEGKVLLLSFSWNFMKTDGYAAYLPENLKKQYIEARTNPKIIHFKPWTYGNYSPYLPFSEYFWKYAAQTPFYDLIISRMKEKKILVSHSIKEQIFLNIKSNEHCGIIFIIKCFITWCLSRFKKTN
jgi:lipopolysaccharide biosynthesis glycosyltransferase